MAALWPDAFVEEASLVQQISQLRKTLGEGANETTPYIETVPKRGYRFVADVTDSWEEEPEEAQLELVDPSADAASDLSRRREAWRVAAGSALALALVGVGLFLGMRLRGPAPSETGYASSQAPLRKFGLKPPVALYIQGGIGFHPNDGISPNGKYIVFTEEEDYRLWIHDLEEGRSRPLEGTEGADDPFWSPDSDFLGYFSGAQIRTISVSGGAPTHVYVRAGSTDAFGGDNRLRGGAWSHDGNTIVFSEDGRLYEIPAVGGTPQILVSTTEPERSSGTVSVPTGLIRWPHFLPPAAGARVLAYTFGSNTKRTIVVHDLESGHQETLGPGELPFYSPSGHLVYQAGPTTYDLWARPFSLNTLQAAGRAFPIAQNGRHPTVSDDGTLSYIEPGLGGEQLVWYDRAGEQIGTIGQPHPHGAIHEISLSPDGQRVAVSAVQNGNRDIWIHEVDRPIKTRLTVHENQDMVPIWSPDGDRIAFTSVGAAGYETVVVGADGMGKPKPILAGAGAEIHMTSWGAEDRILIFERNLSEIFYLRRKEEGGGYEEVPFLETGQQAKLSPDRQYIAYQSDHSGQYEIYIRSFPDGKRQQRVSLNGGVQPRWRSDGNELFYVEDDTLMAVPVRTSPKLSIGSAERLFSSTMAWRGYGATQDGKRFIVRTASTARSDAQIRVVLNWYEEFRDREQE